MEQGEAWGEVDFARYCRDNSIQISDGQIESLSRYVKSLSVWNLKHNLISRADIHNVWKKHMLPSIGWLTQFSLPFQAKVLDIGSGAGFPGIPLAILRPDLQVTLLDSIRKKTDSLLSIVKEIGVDNVAVVNNRAENLADTPGFLRAFDFTIARAVAPLADLIQWSIPLLSKSRTEKHQFPSDGAIPKPRLEPPLLLALKGGDLAAEIRDASRKFRNLKCEEVNLKFHSLEPSDLLNKKLVIVQFR